MRRRKRPSGLCCYCGHRKADEWDHVPPKSIFRRPLPHDQIKVPACAHCNDSFQKSDEKLRVAVSLLAGTDTPELRAFWKEQALSTLRRNARMRNEILRDSRHIEVVTPGGLYLGKAFAVPFLKSEHNRSMERIVRGLYYHHFHERLGPAVQFNVYRREPHSKAAFDETVRGLLPDMAQGGVGGDQFMYRYGRAGEDSLGSVWLLRFQKRHLMLVLTLPVVRRDEAVGAFSPWPRQPDA